MTKYIKKITAYILVCVMTGSLVLSGCSKGNENVNNKNDKSKVSTEEQKKVQKEFDDYMNELFVNEMSENSVSTHFILENPEAYGISFEKASWGEPVTTESINEDFKAQKEILDRLKTFDTSLLSTDQQITYDTIYKHLENSYSVKDYYLFEELFSPINGVHSQIPIIFSEYDFFTKKDIEDYIYLMDTIDAYIENLLEYERLRAQSGYFLTDDSADAVIANCKDFIAPDENCLISIFSEKLDSFGVSDTEKESYMSRFTTAVEEKLIPSYKNIISTLTELKGSRSTPLGLSEFKNGKTYYESLVRSYTGSDKSIDELIELVEQSLANNISLVYTIISENPDIYDEFSEFEYPKADPETTVEMQIKKSKKYFPEIGNIPYTVKSVPKSLETTMSPAFYLVPPIDNKDKNMIYINYSEDYEHMNLFSTLAHEGVPGHMYQCYYYASTNPAPIRNIMDFGGYTEGWATYVEYYAYGFAGMNRNLAVFASANDRYNLGLYSRIDLGIHYEGWDIKAISDFLGIYGIYDDALAKELYNTLIDDPAVYLQYFIGYLEIDELRKKAEDKLDSFDITEFHKFILDIGPTFFDIIDKQLDSWIKTENSK